MTSGPGGSTQEFSEHGPNVNTDDLDGSDVESVGPAGPAGDASTEPPFRTPVELSVSSIVLLVCLGALLSVAVSTWGLMGGRLALSAATTFVLLLPALAWIDYTTYRLPNVLVSACAAPALALVVADVFDGGTDPSRLWVAAATGLGTGVFLLALNVVSGGGIGMGDVKFATVAAALLAVKSVPVALTAMFMFAPLIAMCAVPLVYLLTRVEGTSVSATRFAYGPYLIAAAVVGIFLPMDFSFPGT